MVGDIPDTLELRQLLKQSLLDTVFQRHIDHTAALATTTELQHGNFLVNHFYQINHAAMGRKARINLGLKHVIDLVFDRTVV